MVQQVDWDAYIKGDKELTSVFKTYCDRCRREITTGEYVYRCDYQVVIEGAYVQRKSMELCRQCEREFVGILGKFEREDANG